MKNNLFKVVNIVALSMMILTLTGCNVLDSLFGTEEGSSTAGSGQNIDLSKDMSEEEEAELVNNGIEFEEEVENATLRFRKSDEKEYYGTWSITSGNAIYMYGNLKITVLPRGKWKGTVVDEEITGNWKFDNNKMILSSDHFSSTLAFTNEGVLVLQEDRSTQEETDIVTVVMTRADN